MKPFHASFISALLVTLPVSGPETFAQAVPDKNAEALIKSIAVATRIPELTFEKAALSEVVSYLRRKSIECSPEKNPARRGLNFISTISGKEAPPITLSLKDVTLWDAVEEIAKAANVEATITGNFIVFRSKAPVPPVPPVPSPVAALEKAPVWRRAGGIILSRVVFSEASVSNACASLKAKSKGADGKQPGVDLLATGIFERGVSMDVGSVRLSDVILVIAQSAGAEIAIDGERIILRPAKKAG